MMIRDVIRMLGYYRAEGFAKRGYIVLCFNENPYPPHPDVVEAVKGELGNIGRYPDPEYRELKDAIAEYLRVDLSEIAVGNGASDVLNNVCVAVLDAMDEVTIPIPSYTMYSFLSMLRDARINFVEYPYYRIDPSLIDKARKSKLIFLCSPNNPTGNIIDHLEFILSNFKGFVVLDEAYAEFASRNALNLIDEFENLIIVRTFSKFFGLAGLRIGYAVSKNGEIIEALEKIRLPFCINRIAVKAAIAALEHIDYYQKIRVRIHPTSGKKSKYQVIIRF